MVKLRRSKDVRRILEGFLAMKITVNGKEVELNASKTVADFILERNITGKMFVIEKNLEIIQKADYERTELKEGDVIELVGFVGGG